MFGSQTREDNAMGGNTKLSVYLEKGERLETRKVKIAKSPSFYKVGKGSMNKDKVESVDLIEELVNMTKPEQLVILTIKNELLWDNPTGEVNIQMSKVFTKCKTKAFLKGFKLLNEKDLVRRTKRSHYMINPHALIPYDFAKAVKLWNEAAEQL